MRAVFVIVTVLAALYAGYWFVGSAQVESRAAAAIEAARAEGWTVDYDGLDTRGFPSRFDTTVTNLVVSPPDGSWTWAAPFVQVLALSYRPNQVIAVFPPEQVVTVAGRPVTVTADGLRASALLGFRRDLPLRDARVESGALSLAGQGWSLDLDRMVAGIREAPDAGTEAGPDAGPVSGPASGPVSGPARYDLFADVFGLGTPAAPARLDEVRLDAGLALDAPLDRRLAGAPRLLGLDLRDARVVQGPSTIGGSGSLGTDAQGFLAGTVVLAVEGWRTLLDNLRGAGLMGEGPATLLGGALERLGGGADRIEVPVTFADGRVSALGLPLLAAPLVAPPGG